MPTSLFARQTPVLAAFAAGTKSFVSAGLTSRKPHAAGVPMTLVSQSGQHPHP